MDNPLAITVSVPALEGDRPTALRGTSGHVSQTVVPKVCWMADAERLHAAPIPRDVAMGANAQGLRRSVRDPCHSRVERVAAALGSAYRKPHEPHALQRSERHDAWEL